MKRFRELTEAVKDKFDVGEYDQEGDMAKSDLRSILANAKRVHDMLEDSDNLPEWVQAKITKAEDYMSTVANYMEAEMNEEVELDESVDDKHFSSQSKKMQDAINLHLRKGKSYKEAVVAARKHVKEDFEQIDELNKSTLSSYIKKASQDKADRANTTGFRAGVKQPAYNTSDETSKEVNRGKGIARAADRLAREEVENMQEGENKQIKGGDPCWKGYEMVGKKMKNGKEVPNCVPANEEKQNDLPFTPDAPKKKDVVVGKKPEGYSIARQLARAAMQKQMQKTQKKKIDEQDMPMTDAQKSISRKAKIVKDIAKKNNESDDKFQDSPELKTHITKA